jgi:SAM-dependent methyltransferase
MAHWEQRDFIVKIKNKLPHYFTQSKVLEVGSLNINGTIRDFFTDCKYIGIDVSPGVGVDVVCEGQNYNAPDDIYDVVCSAECFEHNPYWLETFQNMIRLCKDDGLILFTCATDGRGEHGTSRTAPLDSPLTVDMGWDYYRNLNENDFVSQLNFDFYFSEYQFEVNDQSHDLYFWGILKKKILNQFQ